MNEFIDMMIANPTLVSALLFAISGVFLAASFLVSALALTLLVFRSLKPRQSSSNRLRSFPS